MSIEPGNDNLFLTAPVMLYLAVSNLTDVGVGYYALPMLHMKILERGVIIYCTAPLTLLR